MSTPNPRARAARALADARSNHRRLPYAYPRVYAAVREERDGFARVCAAALLRGDDDSARYYAAVYAALDSVTRRLADQTRQYIARRVDQER